MALEFLNESPAEAAEASAMEQEAPPPAEAKVEPAQPAKAEPEPPAPADGAAPEAAAEKLPEKPAERPAFVPHAALQEERTRRQALERELADLKAKAAPEEAKEIDPDTDPIGAVKANSRIIAELRAQISEEKQTREFSARIQSHENDFAAATPDYGKAMAHLREGRAAELEALGLPKEQIGQQLYAEAMRTADYAFQQGKNPGEVFYSLAKVRGYKLAADPAPQPEPQPDPAVETRRRESESVVDRIARGQRAARPTAGAGGGAPNSEVTLADLANLEGAAFDNAMAKFDAAQKARERMN